MIHAVIFGALIAQGWTAQPVPSVPNSLPNLVWASPVEWHSGGTKISFIEVKTPFKSVGEEKSFLDARMSAAPKIPGSTINREDVVPICDGKQSGFLYERTFGTGSEAVHTLELDAIYSGIDYQVVWEGPGTEPVPTMVVASLTSLCVP